MKRKDKDKNKFQLPQKYPLLNQLNDLAIMDIVLATSEKDLEKRAEVALKWNIGLEEEEIEEKAEELVQEVREVKKYIHNSNTTLKSGLFPMSVALRALPIGRTATDTKQALNLQQTIDSKSFWDPFGDKRMQVAMIFAGCVTIMVVAYLVVSRAG